MLCGVTETLLWVEQTRLLVGKGFIPADLVESLHLGQVMMAYGG